MPPACRPVMEDRIFLGKYRVRTTKNPQWWEAQRGQFGFTCQGEGMASGRPVVLTLVPAFLLGERERAALRRAAREAMQFRHVNLPALYEFGEEGEQFVYVTEHVPGRTARAWIDAHGPMPVATALGIALQVANALAVAGRYQIHHAAIHPGNLLIVPGSTTADGWPLVKLLHFPGLARTFDFSNPMAAAAAAFASPEQIAGAPVDFRAETYSLGATLWFLCSATEPDVSPERSEKKRAADPPWASRKFAGAPESVGRLLARMLAENRDARPVDAIALEEEIRACLSKVDPGEVVMPAAPVAPDRVAAKTPWRRFGTKLLATAGAAAILAVALSGMTEHATGNKPVDAATLPNEPARRTSSPETRKVIAPENLGGATAAMNFAVDPPSYESNGERIRAVQRSPGTALAEVFSPAEPAPPGEGPDGPMVEVGTNAERGRPTNTPAVMPPVAIAPRSDPVSPRQTSSKARN